MNIRKLMYLLLLLALSSINVQAANGRGSELSARQLCERYHSSRECLNMEQARHRELEQQRDEDARDNRRDSRHDSRDTSKAAREERQCRRHPEKCAVPSTTQQDRDDYELQRLCERNYSRQQCLEMYYELHQQRARDQLELRQHEVERRDRDIAPPRAIERRDTTPRDNNSNGRRDTTPRDNNSNRLSPKNSENRESAW